MKTCTECQQTKDDDDFARRKQWQRVLNAPPEGRIDICRSCKRKQEQRRHYEENKAEYRRKADQWRAENPEARKKIAREYQRKRRWEKLGITQQDYDRLMEECGDACVGCLRPFGQQAPACVDHCHDSGAIRGLLCHGCNLALGYTQDDPDRLDRLAAYLRSHGR